MIGIYQIIEQMAEDIDASATMQELSMMFGKPVKIKVGYRPDAELFAEDECPVVSVAHAADNYNAGWIEGNRQLPINIRCAVYDKRIEDSGRIETYRGVLDADKLGMCVIDSIRDAEYGDDVVSADYRIDSSAWPYVEIFIDVIIEWPVLLASEATI